MVIICLKERDDTTCLFGSKHVNYFNVYVPRDNYGALALEMSAAFLSATFLFYSLVDLLVDLKAYK